MAFGAIIQGLIKNAVKSAVNFEVAVDPLIAQLQQSCPPKAELDRILQQKNQLSQALTQVQTTLTTITDTSNTINGVLTGVNTAVTIIKTLPIPSSVPPGVGIPLNVINGFSSALDALGILIKEGQGTVSQIIPAIRIITNNIATIQDKLSQLDSLLVRCLEEQTVSLTNEEKEADVNSLGINLSSPSTTGDGTQNEETLEDRLSANALNPYIYKGYTIVLDSNANNKFSFPERRALATNSEGTKIVGPWSYSASTQVLIDGIKFEIDKQEKLALREADALAQAQALKLATDKIQAAVLSQTSGTAGTVGTAGTTTSSSTPPPPPDFPPFGTPGYTHGHVRFKSGKAWRWLAGSQPKWVEHTISYQPFTEKGTNGEERFIRENPSTPFPRVYYKWNETLYKWVFERRVENSI